MDNPKPKTGEDKEDTLTTTDDIGDNPTNQQTDPNPTPDEK